MSRQLHVFVFGDVIGVGFRAWTAIQAKKMGITGWVKNNYEKNCVEALLQAEEDTLKRILELLKQGPPISRVIRMETKWSKKAAHFEDFEIIK